MRIEKPRDDHIMRPGAVSKVFQPVVRGELSSSEQIRPFQLFPPDPRPRLFGRLRDELNLSE